MITDTLNGFSFWRKRRLPIHLQTEAAECGLICLTMVAGYWGHESNLAVMRQRFSVSLKGANLRGLMTMASALKLRPRPLKLSLEHLKDLNVPCVLHWDLNHFVVLRSVTSKQITIHDPAIGLRKFDFTTVGQHFTGVALELHPTAEFHPHREPLKITLKSLMGRVVGLKHGLLHLAALGLVLQFCSLIAPFYLQWIVDSALVSGDRDLIVVLATGFLLLVLLQTCIFSVRGWATTVLSTQLNLQWLSNTFAHLLKLPMAYFERRHTGDVVSRFSSIDAMQRCLTTQFVQSIIDGILMVGTLTMMLLYSVKLALITSIAVGIFVSFRWLIFTHMREAAAEQIIHEAKQQTHFLETIRGIQSIRVYGAEGGRLTTWANALADQFNASLRLSRLAVMNQTGNTLIFGVERVIVVGLAAIAVLDGIFSVGMLFAFLSYKDQFSQRTSALVDSFFEFRMLRLHAERLADIVFSEAEETMVDFEVLSRDVIPSINLRNVSYRFSDLEPPVLDDFSLNVGAGEFVAITGTSGCGKTTAVKLILGLLQPTKGEILIDGYALPKLGLSNYRSMVGAVMQDDSLFAGSVADNISFFDPGADPTHITECATMAAIHDEISLMPMGYNTLVGDIGTGISGGQKQRILLARALYRRPKILILDEATSHLDIWNEKAVNEAIRNLRLTRIIVAHRPETISMAERVVVMDQGRIVQDIWQRPDARLQSVEVNGRENSSTAMLESKD